MPERYERDNREEVFDEEYVKHVEARRRKAKMRRAQQEKNIMKLGLIGGAIVLVLIIILISSVSCSTGKDEEVTTPMATEAATTEAATTAPEETTLVTMYTTDVLNLRTQPNTNAEIIVQIGAGKRVDVISEEGKWCKVKRGKDEGYVMKKYLSYMNTF